MKRKYRYRPRRRGVLILVVLALLTLFTLITITYVVVSKQAMSSSQTANRFEQVRPDHEALLNGALLQIVRGTNNRDSTMFGNSLGADMYGTWLSGTLSGNATRLAETEGQFLRLEAAGVDENPFGEQFPHQVEDYYRGRILTMVDGPAAGKSTRIVYSGAGQGTLHVMAFGKSSPDGTNPALPQSGNRFLINGREFTGNRNTGHMLLTNLSTATYRITDNGALYRRLRGLNESYDAVDFNNMLLGRFPEEPSLAGGQSENTIIPSLHRPALIRYLMAQGGNQEALRNAMLRPSGEFHYMVEGQLDFTGKQFDPVNGPWDVDTDGDGILDAVWVDLGHPVLTTADGRSYKPLFAIRCQDMDGRVNVNTAGSNVMVQGAEQSEIGNYDAFRLNGERRFAGRDRPVSSETGLSRGQGVGPAEINPGHLYPAGLSATGFAQLLEERYGEDGKPGKGTRANDKLSQIEPFRVPFSYTIGPGAFATNKSYGSPPDRLGRRFVGLDPHGQPLYQESDTSLRGELENDPYRLLLSRFGPVGLQKNLTGSGSLADTPYSVYELERVLRRFDRDASLLPDRLLQLIDSKDSNDGIRYPRQDITVASFSQSRLPIDIVELVGQRVSGDTNAWIRDNLDPELLAGLPMDINRPFGDGFDNAPQNGNVDEPGENNVRAWENVFPGVNSVQFDLNNDGTPNDNNITNRNSDAYARQRFARHLYCLAMLLVDTGYVPPFDVDGDGQRNRNDTAQWLAQWAVNVVDFRDRDPIMTRFAYDPNPFDGWNDDDNQNPQTSDPRYMKNVVFGCEEPGLVLTETLAWHDRRIQKVDPTTGDAYKDGAPVDNGVLRQMGRPRGNLLIELYHHPRSPHHTAPVSLYDSNGLELGKRVSGSGGRSGVWRLAFTREGPQSQVGRRLVLSPKSITSVAYFFGRTGNEPIDDLRDETVGDKRFYVAGANAAATIVVERNSYAVIMSAKELMLGQRTLVAGETENTADANAKTDSTYPVEIVKQGNNITIEGDNAPMGINSILSTMVAVVMDPQYFDAAKNQTSKTGAVTKRRFSVSEPAIGYPIVSDVEDNENIDNKYYEKDILKTKMPLDADPDDDADTKPHSNVYLQRLADPTRVWDRKTNPYIVVDVMSADEKTIDVTKYSGEDTDVNELDVKFTSRQRGDRSADIWRAVSKVLTDGSKLKTPIRKATFGYLNDDAQLYGPPLGANPQIYEGAPSQKPFPWLTWNNRPFVSQMELLLVPATSARQLVEMHNTHQVDPFGANRRDYNPYDLTNTPLPSSSAPFPHLMNYFHSKGGASAAPGLFRLLEVTYVPSPFVGTQTWLSPTAFVSGAGTEKFHPPFNKVSKYREPGRMNLNTIFSREVFKALINPPDDAAGNAYVNALWTAFVATRRGSMTQNDPKLPTEYGNPFRSSKEADRVPVNAMVRKLPVNATLLRAKLGANGEPGRSPLFSGATTKNVNSAVRNPFFRYQPLMRLGNLTTTRSNVYAIWITLGFFEVSSVDDSGSPLPVDVNYKDGYRLVQELGSEVGDVERHRAFFIIDRSIPFGFQRGQNHNVHDAILLSRQIE